MLQSMFPFRLPVSGDDPDAAFFSGALSSLFLFTPITMAIMAFVEAPYGKHAKKGWGPTISPSLAWFLMESPTLWLTLILYPFGRRCAEPAAIALIAFYLFHYFHRTCIYPMYLRSGPKKTQGEFPALIAFLAFGFNLLNAYVQTRWVSNYGAYPAEWLRSPRFVLGAVVFGIGMAVNVWADRRLISLKGDGSGGYKIPGGGLFELVSCPNYLGEVVEWLGWAVMTWSAAGAAFSLSTAGFLIRRAAGNHKWYMEKFSEEYPKSRKRVIPFVY